MTNFEVRMAKAKNHFRIKSCGEGVRKSNASALIDIAAAGLRHSRAPFPVERACAESQAQQRSLPRELRFFRQRFMKIGR